METYWERNKVGEERGFGKENVRKKFRQEEESKNRESIYSGINHWRNEQSSFPSLGTVPVRVPTPCNSFILPYKKEGQNSPPKILTFTANFLYLRYEKYVTKLRFIVQSHNTKRLKRFARRTENPERNQGLQTVLPAVWRLPGCQKENIQSFRQ